MLTIYCELQYVEILLFCDIWARNFRYFYILRFYIRHFFVHIYCETTEISTNEEEEGEEAVRNNENIEYIIECSVGRRVSFVY